MNTRVLFIGEVVGKGGVFAVKTLLPQIKKEKEPDFIVADCESTTGGFGLGMNHSIYLHKLGIDVITGGEKIYFKKDLVPFLKKASFILRPANYPYGNPGRGWKILEKDGKRLCVLNLMGQSGFIRTHLDNPLRFLDDFFAKNRNEGAPLLIDFHAATTAEKYTMFYFAEGKAAAVIGTHTKVQTSDEQLLPGGTAVICDAGRTGSQNSVGGLEAGIEIDKFIRQLPEKSRDAFADIELQGVLVEINSSGKAVFIERIKYKTSEVPDVRESEDN